MERGAEHITDAIQRASFSETLYKRLSELEEVARLLQEELSQLNAQVISPRQIPTISEEQLKHRLEYVLTRLETNDLELKQQLVRQLIMELWSDRKRLRCIIPSSLTNQFGMETRAQRDSNPRPLVPKTNALSTELWALI